MQPATSIVSTSNARQCLYMQSAVFHHQILTLQSLEDPFPTRWTGSLASFLDHLCRHFSKRVVSEQSPGSYEDTTDDESEGEAMELDPPAGVNGANGAHRPRAKLSAETQQRVAQLITKLASRAQYAKVPKNFPRNHTRGYSVKSLCPSFCNASTSRSLYPEGQELD